jgi:murein DD-endopeptidase MepM/ murein hydrolase activator NlpD
MVLLASAALAFGGLAVLPADDATSVRVRAAAATTPLVLDQSEATAPTQKDLDMLYGIPAAPVVAPKPAVPRAPARASRAKREAPRAKWVRPGVGHFTSAFKWRWGRMHTGIDIAGPYGSPIRAVGDGEVIEAGHEGGYGNIVKVRLEDGTVTYYAHLSKILVYSGPVKAGDVIAKEGNTGHSTGPHLHFEVRIGGSPINPIPWLAKRGIFI